MHQISQNQRDPASSRPRPGARLALGFQFLVVLPFCLIVLGALVRANGAGLACPDWPLCFGEFIPRFDFKIAFEWGHRVLAGSVGIVFIALAGWTLRQSELRAKMGLGLLVAALMLAQPTWEAWRAGLLIAVAGECLRLWAAGHLEKSREITRSGPYRFLRHPLYAGSIVIAVGVAVASRSIAVAEIGRASCRERV